MHMSGVRETLWQWAEGSWGPQDWRIHLRKTADEQGSNLKLEAMGSNVEPTPPSAVRLWEYYLTSLDFQMLLPPKWRIKMQALVLAIVRFVCHYHTLCYQDFTRINAKPLSWYCHSGICWSTVSGAISSCETILSKMWKKAHTMHRVNLTSRLIVLLFTSSYLCSCFLSFM